MVKMANTNKRFQGKCSQGRGEAEENGKEAPKAGKKEEKRRG